MAEATTETQADRGRSVSRWALVGTLIALFLVLLDVSRTGTHPLNLVQPGADGPSVDVIVSDFPGVDLPTGLGLDGQQFYAVARNPLDLDQTADHLDRPRYRLQRPLLSWLAWVAHPTGGGPGLVWSLFAVNVLATLALAVASGMTAVRLRGPAWVAALVGLYPGVWWSLRVSVADSLATALGLGTIALLLHGRTRRATATGVGAVLAKETAALLLVGWALGRPGDRRRWIPVIAAAAVALGWMALLRTQLAGSESVAELSAPFRGFVDAARHRWSAGDELWGLVGAASGIGAGVAALARRGIRHPMGPAIVVQVGFLVFANGDVIGNDFGAGRATLALLAVSTVAFFSPGDDARRSVDEPVKRTAGAPPRT